MSVTIASSISSSLMAITGLFIVKAIGGVDLYKWDLKKSMLLMCLVLFPILIYNNTLIPIIVSIKKRTNFVCFLFSNLFTILGITSFNLVL